MESFKLSKPFTEGLLERGVLVVPLVTDGELPPLDFEEEAEEEEKATLLDRKKKLWQLRPVFVSEWSK